MENLTRMFDRHPKIETVKELSKVLYHLDEIFAYSTFPKPIEGVDGPINSVGIDFEGTLYPGKGQPMDPALPLIWWQLAPKLGAFDYDELSVHGVTGRPESYGEGFLQSLHLIYNKNAGPHVFEKGYVIAQYGSKESGEVDTRIVDTDAKQIAEDVAVLVRKRFPNVMEEQGKVAVASFNAPRGMTQDEFNTLCSNYLENLRKDPKYAELLTQADWSTTTTDFTVMKTGMRRKLGVDKLFNVLHEKGYSGKSWETFAYMGDSEDDMECMQNARLPVTFPDARKPLKEYVKNKNGLLTPIGYENGFGAALAFSMILEHALYHKLNAGSKKQFVL